MNTETVTQYESRRRQEIQDEAIAKAESNKIKNRAMLSARFGRLGINRPLQRTQQELAVVAAEEKIVLGAVVAPATNIVLEAPKNDAGASLPEALSKSISVEKEVKIEGNSVVNGNKPLDAENSIEATLHAHFDLSDTSIQSGTHLSVADVLNRCGLPVNKANSNVVAALLKNTGHNYCKAKGKRGYWVTVRS